MPLEKKFNHYGQEQKIHSFDKIVKIDGKSLQVRLIRTRKWKGMGHPGGDFSFLIPRAKFVQPSSNFYYLVTKQDLMRIEKHGGR